MGFITKPYTELKKKLIKKFGFCDHNYIIRYDERYDLGDDKNHTFKVVMCSECGHVKSIEQLQ